MRILIAEDEPRIARFMDKGLTAAGYTTTVVHDGIAALDLASAGEADLLVLDVGLPRLDGFQVLRALRESGSTLPILMVTARTGVEDTVQGLELGANDYIAKPFRVEELIARVRLRAREAAGAVHDGGASDVLTHGDLSLDLRTRIARCVVDGRPREVELSAREFALAGVFLRSPDQVLTRDVLLSRAWGYDYDGASNVVDVYVRYLRGKLGADRFVTVRGAGYRLINPQHRPDAR
ncbi:response regulator transcription factor [Brachybacterium sp. EF45031]|uniref:response regulator transcription factor n=1 Tax=Brachybacterium sillae TaxID=2810536 RepID=UPI00217CF53B|nr:response regulator transcription factor [Brachybacterium sillae]MCS6711592.1 response regulator transcription factor [Brachybacterium sillae]